MTSVLFVTCDAGGNVPPVLAVAQELSRRGHDVRVMGHPVQAETVASAGLPFTAFERARPFRGTDKNGPLAWVAMFGDRGMGRDIAAQLDAWPADLVAIDCMAFGAIEAVAQRQVPYVLLEHTLHTYWDRAWLRGPMGIGLRLKRFPTSRLTAGARARVVLSLPELEPSDGTAPNVVHAGPVAAGAPARATEPTVLVSLSTIRFPGMKKTLQRVLDAVAELPVRGYVTTGPVIDPAELRVPSNVEAHRFVPHSELMPRVSVVVGHGGHATTMASLAHDLPLVVLPLHPMLDQKMVGAAVAEAGAARLLTKNARPAQIAAAITELLADGPHRAAAARLGAQVRASSGARRAAEVLESLLVRA